MNSGFSTNVHLKPNITEVDAENLVMSRISDTRAELNSSMLWSIIDVQIGVRGTGGLFCIVTIITITKI